MYIEFEVHNTNDFVDLIEEELFSHATRDEAAECILNIISAFFNHYDKE